VNRKEWEALAYPVMANTVAVLEEFLADPSPDSFPDHLRARCRAAAENEQIEETLLIERRRAATVRSAADQLDGMFGEAKEDLAEARRREHAEAFARLAGDRYALEDEAEAQMDALLSTLEQLRQLDVRQRHQGSQAGRSSAGGGQPLERTLHNWLSARFGGVGGYLDLNKMPGTEGASLPELDPLARKDKEG